MLNLEIFDLKLETEFVGRNFIYHSEIDSTNSFLLNFKENKLQSGTVLFAEKQNAGKGRRDRTWHSLKEQNLTFSILLSDEDILNQKLSLINLLSSLAVANSIENLFQLKCNLKWPNDVLVNNKKISGILISTSIRSDKFEKIVIGIGINVNQSSFQGNFNIPPTSLKIELNRTIEREHFLAEVLNNFEMYLDILRDNPAHIVHDWRAKCRMIGDKITVITDDESKSGIFDDIDEEGFLILKTSGRYEKMYFGDVSLA